MAVSISPMKQEIADSVKQKENYPVIEIIPRSSPQPSVSSTAVSVELSKAFVSTASTGPSVVTSTAVDLDLNSLKQESTNLDFLEDSNLPMIPTFAEAFMLSHLGCSNVSDCLSKIEQGAGNQSLLSNQGLQASNSLSKDKMETNNNIKEELEDVDDVTADFPDNMDVDVDNWDQCFTGIEDILSKDIDLESLDIFSSTKMDTDLIKEEGTSDNEADSGLIDDDVEVEDSGINMDRDLDSEGNSRDSSQDTDGYSLSSGNSPPAPAERKLDISCLGLSPPVSSNNRLIGLPTGLVSNNSANVVLKKPTNVADAKFVTNNIGTKAPPTLAYNIIPPLLQPQALPSPSAGPGGSLSLDNNRDVVSILNSQTASNITPPSQVNHTKVLQTNLKEAMKTITTREANNSTATTLASRNNGSKRIKLSFPLERKLDLSCTCAKCKAEKNSDKSMSGSHLVELPGGAVVPTGTVTVTTSTGLKLPAAVQSYVLTSSSSAVSTPSLLLPTSSGISSTGKSVLMSPSQRVNETVRALLSAAANQAMAKQTSGDSKQPDSATINNIMTASRAKVASLLSKHSLTTTIPLTLTSSAVTSTTQSSSVGPSPGSVSISPSVSPPLNKKIKESEVHSSTAANTTIASLRLKTKLAAVADSKRNNVLVLSSGSDSKPTNSSPTVTVASNKKQSIEGSNEPGPPDLTCVACTKTFSRRYNLRRHQMSLGHWAPISHPNPITFKSTRLDQNMPPNQAVAKREEIHDDEKPYVCEACSMRFTLKSSLRRHQIKFGHIAQSQPQQSQTQQAQQQQMVNTTVQQPSPQIIQPVISQQQLQQPQVTPVITLKSPVSVQSLHSLPQLTVVSCSTPTPAVSPDIPSSSVSTTAATPATTISLMIIPCIKRKDGSDLATTLNIAGRTVGVESVK